MLVSSQRGRGNCKTGLACVRWRAGYASVSASGPIIALHDHAVKDTYQHANKGSKDPDGQQSYQQFAGIQALQPSLEPQAATCHPHIARLLSAATRREGPLTAARTLAAEPRSKFGRLIAAPVFARVGSNLYPAFPLVCFIILCGYTEITNETHNASITDLRTSY